MFTHCELLELLLTKKKKNLKIYKNIQDRRNECLLKEKVNNERFKPLFSENLNSHKFYIT